MSLEEGKEPGMELVEKRINEDIDELAREEMALVRKIDLYLLPTIWIMYLLSYMDRTNIGNAKVAGVSHTVAPSQAALVYMLSRAV